MSSMKKAVLIVILLVLFRNIAHAGFLTGDSSPYVEGQGLYAFKLNASILMVGTPFSIACLSGKYGYDDRTSVYAKYGIGKIDYSTVSGTRLSTDPQASALGIEYVLSGAKKSEYYALITEYETVSWSVNRKSNISNEIMIGMDYSNLISDTTRTRYRIALHNFNAGVESEEKIGTSVKYSLSTEVSYNFSKNIKGSFEAGIYIGDPIGGIIALFGLGLGFNP
jgi:hypothetical protein